MTTTTVQRMKTPSRVASRRTRKPNDLAQLVRRAIDEGADSVEKVHQEIAALPFEMLERIDGFEGLPKVRQFQKKSIGAVYDVIHSVNHEVARLADELLAKAKPKRSSAARRSRGTRRAV